MTLAGCAAHVHKVGAGPSGNDIVEARQWYILWGLVPLNEVDSNVMAAGAKDYEITTSQQPLDIIINIFTGIVTVNSRTVTVTK
ncbi:MAG: hypothetical protein KJ970_12415 [Candidatus Eisenbacteria bacterium]|uniref:Uncharacterized protein n=1 Tax=Eiseniibacteriota bacterium TaxID=2212470 RepID=A0A948W7K1_UNCEI|nr:hypothetical protein [Candidatus Eisenbacteria bacterium]MBU1947500.1 hypothetical protein [Candidatus Eisenbacteria bacterium]MBU2691721.1 hypothetical protein [Candidatus Eisenbacteria bacterium]